METISRESLLEYANTEDGKRILLSKSGGFVGDEAELSLIRKTIEFVKNPENKALGVAANQVGSLGPWFVARMGRPESIVVVVNPTIIGRNGRRQHIEGCFSEKNPSKVKRSVDVTVNYDTINWNGDPNNLFFYELVSHKLVTLSGRDAQVFQHECDHLKGVLICERGTEIKENE